MIGRRNGCRKERCKRRIHVQSGDERAAAESGRQNGENTKNRLNRLNRQNKRSSAALARGA